MLMNLWWKLQAAYMYLAVLLPIGAVGNWMMERDLNWLQEALVGGPVSALAVVAIFEMARGCKNVNSAWD